MNTGGGLVRENNQMPSFPHSGEGSSTARELTKVTCIWRGIGDSMRTRTWIGTREGSCTPRRNSAEKGSHASREAQHGEGAGLAVGPVVAMRGDKTPGAKGPCQRHSEQESKAGMG